MTPAKTHPPTGPLTAIARIVRAASLAAWRERRERKRRLEGLRIEREVERRRRYYCRRRLGGLDAAVSAIEAEMTAVTAEELIALGA